MRNRTGIAVGFALVLLLAAVLAPTAGAKGWKHELEDSDLLHLETFNLSGEFSGELSGDISINGNRYQLASNVQVYEIGAGVIPAGSQIDNRRLFISGVSLMGSNTIFSVIVLPATVPSLDQVDMSANVSIHTASPENE